MTIPEAIACLGYTLALWLLIEHAEKIRLWPTGVGAGALLSTSFMVALVKLEGPPTNGKFMIACGLFLFAQICVSLLLFSRKRPGPRGPRTPNEDWKTARAANDAQYTKPFTKAA